MKIIHCVTEPASVFSHILHILISVADPECLSRFPDPIFSLPPGGDKIPYPDPHQKI
jgi:hypothetical protein